VASDQGARTRSRCQVDVIGDGPAGQQASCYYEVVGTEPGDATHLPQAALQARP
jgi:hypothetical protein